ncbi:hypothetical protein BT96DRAFT_391628 [Gymnopus androsaceus JB14]|uniref:Uncharacterized protein n=1 Tax=Gymnopus androsaceus JB14 TaxID=1447944 RepID=A0A6A4GWK4_9AGAR|nr:hypothetical protein BT96DRAFT_391628 [Gymnopus androsaceus JB14]
MNETSHPVYVHTSQSKRRAGEVVGPRERTCWIWGYQCQISLIVNRQRQRQRKQKQSSPCTDPHLPPKLISSPMFHLEYLRQPRAMSIPRFRLWETWISSIKLVVYMHSTIVDTLWALLKALGTTFIPASTRGTDNIEKVCAFVFTFSFPTHFCITIYCSSSRRDHHLLFQRYSSPFPSTIQPPMYTASEPFL